MHKPLGVLLSLAAFVVLVESAGAQPPKEYPSDCLKDYSECAADAFPDGNGAGTDAKGRKLRVCNDKYKSCIGGNKPKPGTKRAAGGDLVTAISGSKVETKQIHAYKSEGALADLKTALSATGKTKFLAVTRSTVPGAALSSNVASQKAPVSAKPGAINNVLSPAPMSAGNGLKLRTN